MIELRPGEPTPPLIRHTSQDHHNTVMHFAHRVRDNLSTLSGARGSESITLNGNTLDLAELVAVARHGVKAEVDPNPQLRERINHSVDALEAKLNKGDLIYGVNTGFGGSADTRTSNLASLQRALVQHQNVGILTRSDIGREPSAVTANSIDVASTSMPTPWTRGLMLSRVNSLLRGHSAVSIPVIGAIIALLNHDMTPVVPLRGSISASGDLQPLSYVAAVLQGSPSVYVRIRGNEGQNIVTAPEALAQAGLKPIVLGAKEGLGLINGTAASVSLASLVLHDTNNLALLCQALTVTAVEALTGTAGSFDPFISVVRPHRGQEHAAATMINFLQGSKLAHGLLAEDVDHKRLGLCQDRYALRTSPQWIGPLLEDLELANSQVTIELNSTTDNPLINTNDSGTIHHGGNFQASSVTSAMEKTRNVLQQLGKIIFAQSTEMNSVSMNRGLPPNLCADDPSLSFTCKGLDITMAAYASELGWLNHAIGPHVQSAEMHNQAVNSLALLSGRATCQAVEVLSSMCAAQIFMLCQALDLRVLQIRFFAVVGPESAEMTEGLLTAFGVSQEEANATASALWNRFKEAWNATTILDLRDRCDKTAEGMAGQRQAMADQLHATYSSLRSELFTQCLEITPTYLGSASSFLYRFVRNDLGVPFFRGLAEDPTEAFLADPSTSNGDLGRTKETIGGWLSIIFAAIENGSLFEKLVELI